MVKRLVVTGYKSFELGVFNDKHPGIQYIKKAIKKQLLNLLEDGLEWVIISGQLGVELWAAEVVYELQEDYPELKLAIILAFLNQEKSWKEEKQEYYQSILASADFVDVVSKREYEGPWQLSAKNRFLLEHSDGLLALYDDEKEGSPKYITEGAVKRALSTDYKVFTITSYDIQLIVEEEQFENM